MTVVKQQKDRVWFARVRVFEPSATGGQHNVIAAYEGRIMAGSQAEADSILADAIQRDCAARRIRLSQWQFESLGKFKANLAKTHRN